MTSFTILFSSHNLNLCSELWVFFFLLCVLVFLCLINYFFNLKHSFFFSLKYFLQIFTTGKLSSFILRLCVFLLRTNLIGFCFFSSIVWFSFHFIFQLQNVEISKVFFKLLFSLRFLVFSLRFLSFFYDKWITKIITNIKLMIKSQITNSSTKCGMLN